MRLLPCTTGWKLSPAAVLLLPTHFSTQVHETFAQEFKVMSSLAGSSRSIGRVLSNPLDLDEGTFQLFEMFMASLCMLFGVVFYVGVRNNHSLATSTAENLSRLLASQFAFIGVGEVDGPKNKKLFKDGHTLYYFHASGRRYARKFTAVLELSRRMDMFVLLSALFNPQAMNNDTCTFVVPLSNDFTMETLCLFLVKKKLLAKLRAKEEDETMKPVEELAGHVGPVADLPEDFTVLTEHQDVINAVLTDSIKNLLTEEDVAKHFLSLHITDNGASWDSQSVNSKRLVRVSFELPKDVTLVDALVEKMTHLTLTVVDMAPKVRIAQMGKKKALDLRRKIAAEEERQKQKKRQEELAAERERAKKEREEAIYKMSADKQAKYEEKKRKKAMRNRAKVVR